MNINDLRKQRCKLSEKCKKDNYTCSRADGEFCGTYAFPDKMWRLGDCLMADNELRAARLNAKNAPKVRVGQQKQKKRK